MFPWLKTQPKKLEIFGDYNAAATEIQGRSLQLTISSLFPAEDMDDIEGLYKARKDRVLLVDVGAGRGQALRDFRIERPDLMGRIVAQDLPEVIAGREEVRGIDNMAYAFFQSQPVKGALPRAPFTQPIQLNLCRRTLAIGIRLLLVPYPPRLA